MNLTLGTSHSNATEPDSTELALAEITNRVFQTNFIPAFIYILILFVIGVPGNALVCYVYHFKVGNKQLSSNIFILALSWFDLINCTFTLPFELTMIYNIVNFDHPILCKLSRFIVFFCNNSTSVILLAIAADRLRVFLSGPINRRVSTRTARVIIVVALVIAAVASWPMIVFYGTHTIQLNPGIVGKTCSISNYYVQQKTFVEIFTITLLCLHFAFDMAFIVIYSILGKKICYDSESNRRLSSSSATSYSINRIHRKGSDDSTDDDVFLTQIGPKSTSSANENNNLLNSSSSSSSSLQEVQKSKSLSLRLSLAKKSDSFRSSFRTHFRSKPSRSSSTFSGRQIFTSRRNVSRTSLMLFIVTIAYMITYLPYCILVVVRTVDPGYYYRLGDIGKSIYQFFIRSYCLGSAINPLIYSFISSRFRKRCKNAIMDIFCCKRRQYPRRV